VTSRPLRFALTGGIATGKSYCLTRFAELGAPTIDSDVLAHRAVAPGSPGFDAVVARFGREVLQPHGEIDRRQLGRVVFGDENARRDLEAIVHPAVYAAIEQWFGQLASRVSGPSSSPARLGIADVPLLYETGRTADFDRVIVAACPPALQLTRLMARSALSEAEARQRIAAQLPIEDKMRWADDVIDTSGSPADTDRRVEQLWASVIGDR
jgi:dephospho-CoA kinase